MTKNEIFERLDEFGKLDDNWDNNGADPINKQVIINTREIVNNLKNNPYFVAPIPWGTIQLEWESNNYYIEIEIEIPENNKNIINVFILLNDDITNYNLTKKIEFEESEFKTIITLIDGLVEFFINK